MEFLEEERIDEFNKFIDNHPQGSFMQTTNWAKVKHTWEYEGIISRDSNGEIKGAMLVLIQKAPAIGTAFLYAPRGPVCDLDDKNTLQDLTDGIFKLAKKHNAHVFKCDPDVNIDNKTFHNLMIELGYEYNMGGVNFETIQPKFNHRIIIKDTTKDDLLMSFQPKTRYNIRLAKRKDVIVRVRDKSYLDEFVSIMEETGERDDFNIRPKWYFEKMLDEMGENARLYMAYYNDIPLAGAIAVRYAKKTNYLYGASSNIERNRMPTYIIQWEMMKWGLENEDYIYDMQGVSGDDDEKNPLYGLIRFKRGFGGETVELTGEYFIPFKPIVNKAIDLATKVRSKIL